MNLKWRKRILNLKETYIVFDVRIFTVKDLGNGYSEIICLEGTYNYNCNCKYFEAKDK